MKNNCKAFTLIELIVAIVIFMTITVSTYIPYAYYQNKAKVRISTKAVAQSIVEARNFAVNGFEKIVKENTKNGKIEVKKNMDIGLLISKGEKNQIMFYAYPYDMPTDDLMVPEYNRVFNGNHEEVLENIFLFKVKELIYPINIQNIEIKGEVEQNIFILFDSIKGNANIFIRNADGTLKRLENAETKISIAFKETERGPLNQTITYTPQTNLIDY